MIGIAAVIAAAVAVGVATQRRIGERAIGLSRRILGVMLYVLYPPVVFLNLARLHIDVNVGAGIGLAWLAVVLVGLLAYRVSHGLRLTRASTGALINATLHPNTGYLGLPLCAAALGRASLDRAVAYDTLVGVPTLLLGVFGVGAAFGSGVSTWQDRVRRFLTRNPPLVAAVLGLLAPRSLAPDALVHASRVLVYALLPLGFFTVGLTLAGERLRVPPPLTRPIAAAVLLRLVAAPLLLLAVAAPFIHLPHAYLLLAAMPTGVNGLAVAHAYGLDLALAASAIVWSTAIVVVAAVVITLAL